ncbi:MAG: hypothetical protein AAF602_05225 [Myxococcota bacterium]
MTRTLWSLIWMSACSDPSLSAGVEDSSSEAVTRIAVVGDVDAATSDEADGCSVGMDGVTLPVTLSGLDVNAPDHGGPGARDCPSDARGVRNSE